MLKPERRGEDQVASVYMPVRHRQAQKCQDIIH